jgi:hypothetical protein
MAKSTPTLEWCIVRLGEDFNWWVQEVSDTVHWDTDGLSIIDPRQIDHIMELIEPLRDYAFDPDIFERAVIPFRIDKKVKNDMVRLARVNDSILESDEKLFALPDILDDENSAYADLLDHITHLRVKMLNDLYEFDQPLTVDEVEEEIREQSNADFMEGRAVHLYREIVSVLDYVPAGWELDDDDEEEPHSKKAAEDEDDFPDVEEDTDALKGDDTLKWDEDEDEEEDEDGGDEDSEDTDDDEEEEEVVPRRRSRSRK